MKFLLVCDVSLLYALQEFEPFPAVFVDVLLAFVELLKRGFKVLQPPGERFELFDNLRSGNRIILL